MRFDSFSFTGKGGKEYNQDAIGQAEAEKGNVYVVADGLGGHQHGELASQRAVEFLLSDVETEERSAWLLDRLEAANEEIMELQKERGTVKTTVAVLAIDEDRAAWGHVGDTRIYYLHNDAIESVTEDHSVAYMKYRAGEITRDQIGTDEDQPSLLRALGNKERHKAVIAAPEHPVEPGDAFLMCTDGVWVYLQDEEVLVDYLKAATAREWAELLLLRVMERIKEGNDNLSLITVMVSEDE